MAGLDREKQVVSNMLRVLEEVVGEGQLVPSYPEAWENTVFFLHRTLELGTQIQQGDLVVHLQSLINILPENSLEVLAPEIVVEYQTVLKEAQQKEREKEAAKPENVFKALFQDQPTQVLEKKNAELSEILCKIVLDWIEQTVLPKLRYVREKMELSHHQIEVKIIQSAEALLESHLKKLVGHQFSTQPTAVYLEFILTRLAWVHKNKRINPNYAAFIDQVSLVMTNDDIFSLSEFLEAALLSSLLDHRNVQ